MTHLKKLSNDCEFGELKNALIKDIVAKGIINTSLRERTLREPNLTLGKARELGQSTEEGGRNLHNTI